MLLDRGRPEDARRASELLGQAAEAYRAFGMPGYLAEAERRLAAIRSPGPAPRPRTRSDEQSTPRATTAGISPGTGGRRPE
jgi:hypothetical protein